MSHASLEPSRSRRRAWELDRDLVAELARSPRVSLVGRLLARYDVSMFGYMAPMTSALLLAPTAPMIIYDVGEHGVSALKVVSVWLMLGVVIFAMEAARAAWVARHPFASRRWLHAVAGAVGSETITAVLHRLAVTNRSDPDYAIRRSDVGVSVRVIRSARRDAAKEAAQRAGAVRLANDLPPA